MKKIMGLLALCAIGLTSCQKENDGADLGLADQALNGIPVTDLNTGEQTTAYELGQRHRPDRDSSCRKVSVDSLLPAIKDYITTNYPGTTIKRAGTGKDGKFIVIIQLADQRYKLLLFDAKGAFEKELRPKGHRKYGPGNILTEVEIADLIILITSYVDSNYPGSVIERAGMTTNGNFIIALSWNGGRKLILFDENGNFIKKLR